MKEYVLDDEQWNKWEYLISHNIISLKYRISRGNLLACIDSRKLFSDFNNSEVEELVHCRYLCAIKGDITKCISNIENGYALCISDIGDETLIKIISTKVSLMVVRKLLRTCKSMY